MFDRNRYGRILVPMVTPFKEDQSVDYEAAVSVAEKLIEDNKADSIILSGTTGEFYTMTFEERIRLFEVIKEAVGDRIPLVAGIGSASTIETIALARKAEELGYELLMAVSPYYTRPTQRELYNHFKMVAESVSVSLLLYNIPIFTGVNLNPETVASLAAIDNIMGIKEEAELNPKQITAFINATPDDFVIYCGDDTMVLEAFAQGGEKRIGGIVSGASHLIGDQMRNMINLFLAGNVKEAVEMQQKFFRLFRVMGQNGRTNPVSLIKEAMKMIGYNAGIPRLPLTPGTEEEKANIRRVM
ncbi:MAG TPA: 4-hydroxy-tetrahydrodipicolinate synthase, partial [Firmicutes bacterium]|nr:4-hydroxy-tetrahydrodipicolinate synthase [Bacillota bacterium]